MLTGIRETVKVCHNFGNINLESKAFGKYLAFVIIIFLLYVQTSENFGLGCYNFQLSHYKLNDTPTYMSIGKSLSVLLKIEGTLNL